MTGPTEHTTVHTHVVSAPVEVAYGLIADVERWPVIFEPTVHVRMLERSDGAERFRIWALVNGEVASWTSRRTLDPRAAVITFRQEHSRPPLTSMGGEWRFTPLPGNRTEIALTHTFSAEGDDDVEWITRALDTNSERELAALGRMAEQRHPVQDLVMTFEDVVRAEGDTARAYRFVDRADAWPTLLPHVARLDLDEPEPGVQHMEMDTLTSDGSTHTTRSVRLCFPEREIVYKQELPPRLLFGHSGAWEFGEDGLITARHTVAIDPGAVAGVLGEGATVAQAREYLRSALGANSRTTLTHAAAAAGSGTGDAEAGAGDAGDAGDAEPGAAGRSVRGRAS